MSNTPSLMALGPSLINYIKEKKERKKERKEIEEIIQGTKKMLHSRSGCSFTLSFKAEMQRSLSSVE